VAIATIRRRPVGWRYDSVRHSYAARGISTGRKYDAAVINWLKTTKLAPKDSYMTPFFSKEGQVERITSAAGHVEDAGKQIYVFNENLVRVPYAAAREWDWKTMAPKGSYDTSFWSTAGQGERVGATLGTYGAGLKNTPILGGLVGGPFGELETTASVAKHLRGGEGGIGAGVLQSAASQPAMTALAATPAVGAAGKALGTTSIGSKLMFVSAGTPRILTPAWGAGVDKSIAATAQVAPKTAFMQRAIANTPVTVMAGGRVAAAPVGGTWILSSARYPENVWTGYQPGGSWGDTAKSVVSLPKTIGEVRAAREVAAAGGGTTQPLWPAIKGAMSESFAKDRLYGKVAAMNIPLPKDSVVQGVGSPQIIVQGVGVGALPMWRSQGLQAGVGWQLPPGATQ